MTNTPKPKGNTLSIIVTLIVLLGIAYITFSDNNLILPDPVEYTEVTNRPAEAGDMVNIDYSGTMKGESEPFEGGTAEAYNLVLGSNTFIPGFEDAVIGHESGETFTFELAFPDDYHAEDLAGQVAIWTVTINSISMPVAE